MDDGTRVMKRETFYALLVGFVLVGTAVLLFVTAISANGRIDHPKPIQSVQPIDMRNA